MTIPFKIRAWVRQHSRLKALLLPVYSVALNVSWLFCKFVLRRPIGFWIGQQQIRLHLSGSIPEVLFKGSFEFAELDFVSNFLRPGMTVVDAGANVGLYSIISSQRITETGRVHAFEPGRITFKRLQHNLELNNCKNVVPNHMALSNKAGHLILSVDPANPTLDSHCFIKNDANIKQPASTDEIVNCQQLDDYFSPSDWGGIDFIKIDVEGSELSLLQGAEKVLTCSQNLTILLECTKNREKVRDLLQKKGFTCFIWDSALRTLKPAVYDDVIPTSNVIFRRS